MLQNLVKEIVPDRKTYVLELGDSPPTLDGMRLAIEEAEQLGMWDFLVYAAPRFRHSPLFDAMYQCDMRGGKVVFRLPLGIKKQVSR